MVISFLDLDEGIVVETDKLIKAIKPAIPLSLHQKVQLFFLDLLPLVLTSMRRDHGFTCIYPILLLSVGNNGQSMNSSSSRFLHH